MIDCKECVWEQTCNAHRGGVIACPDGKRKPTPSPAELGPQEPPADPRIFNRRQPDGSFRPLAEYWDAAPSPAPAVKRAADWDKLSIGHCKQCGQGHALVDGLCYNCRPA